MIKYIHCPDSMGVDEFLDKNTIFLAGGISNCRNWQDEMVEKLQGINAVVMNPRRSDFDINDPTMSAKQIKWEHDHLNYALAVSFWFPPETLCPITLFEYGFWLSQYMLSVAEIDTYEELTGEPIDTAPGLFLGIDPGYQRKFDLIEQTKLKMDELRDQDVPEKWLVEPVFSLDELAQKMFNRYGQDRQTR